MNESTQAATAPATPRTRGWCHWHKGLGEDPQLVQVVEAGSGPGWSFYACHACRGRRNLVPLADQPEKTPKPTTAQAALIALGEHCVRCPGCRPRWEGDMPVHQECPEADRLYWLYRAEVRAS